MDHIFAGGRRPKLVIFDCDGVLVDTETICSAVMAENFARYGLELAVEDVHQLFVGGTMMSAGEEAAKRGAALPAQWLDEISQDINTALAKGVRVFDGVHALLDVLDRNEIATAIASNGPMEKMQVSLGPSGLFDRFDGRIYSGRAFGAPKPKPDMLLQAAKDSGVQIRDSVMIDDTVTGISAADAAGMPAIGFAAASDTDSLIATGHPVVHSMQEVQKLLGL